MTVALRLLDKLDDKKIRFGKKHIRISADQALQDFSDHLAWLISRHIKRTWSDQYLIEWCFGRSRIFQSESEVNAHCRVNLVVASACFNRLLAEIRGKNSRAKYKDAVRFKEIIRGYVFDLKPIAEYLEQKKDPNYVFLDGGRNYGVHTWEVFRFSRQLAIQSAFRKTPFHLDHKVSQITSVFALRQALEAKYERLVSVLIHNKYGDTPKLRHGFHYDFILSNPTWFNFRAVNFADLKKIYEWCNEVVHKVYHPLAWQIAYAHEICGGLFNVLKTSPGSSWSIHNAVEINNLDSMQQAFIAHFCASYDHGIWSVEPYRPEAAIV